MEPDKAKGKHHEQIGKREKIKHMDQFAQQKLAV